MAKDKNSTIQLIHWNTNGLIKHWHEFKHTLRQLDPHILCIQETHLKTTDPYSLDIYPFSLLRQDHIGNSSIRQGGVAIYLKNNIPFKHTHHNINSDILTVEIYLNFTTITIVNCYFAPYPDLETTFFNDLETVLSSINSPIILCGDFNAHHSLWEHSRNVNTRGRKLHKIINNYQLTCLNNGKPTFPARYSHHQDTTPDISFISSSLVLRTNWDVHPDPFFSDHCPVKIELFAATNQHSTQPRWNLRKANWENFTGEMEKLRVSPTLNEFTDSLIETASRSIPMTVSVRQKQKSVPWWNTECSKAIAIRNRARHRYQRYKTQETLSEFKKAKAHCRRVILQAKRDSWAEHINQFNRFTPLHKIWSLTKGFKNNKHTLLKSTAINHNNLKVIDPNSITELFAEHYALRSTNLPSPIPVQVPEPSQNDELNVPFTLKELELSIQKGGNTNVGPDLVHYTFLKHMGPRSRHNLLTLFNEAWTKRTYPQNWFHAFIIPIPKFNKDHTQLDKYRPISLMSCIHKTFERMVKERLTNFLLNKQVISPTHSGFLPGRSTIDNLVRLTTDIQDAFANKECLTAVFLDIKSAYDNVDISKLLQHLKSIGISGHMLAYFNTYLINRTFQTKYLKHTSETKFPTSGLMQGSILSPILLVIALSSQLKSLPAPTKIAIYADDIAIWASNKYLNNSLAHLQNSLNLLKVKLGKLNLHIEPNKTQCITFGRYNTTNTKPLNLNGTDLPFRDTAKFLGITFDKRFTFKPHLTDISNKALKRVNILRSLTSTDWGGDRATLTKLYEAIIRPIMEYGSIVF